jgi:hypothetical protein
MLGDVLAEGATFFGSILNNLRRVVIRLKVDISSCGVKHGNYLAPIIVILVMLLGLGRRQGKQAKDGYSGGGNALSGGDIGDTGIGGLVVAKAIDILPAKVSQGLVRLIGGLVAFFPNSIPSKALGGFLWRHFVVITPVIVRPLFGGEAGILIVVASRR